MKKENKFKNKKLTIKAAALQAFSRIKICHNCKFDKLRDTNPVWSDVCFSVCANAYIRGFNKGYKYAKEKTREKTL